MAESHGQGELVATTGMQGRGSGAFSGLYAMEGVEQSGWSEHSILATLFATATRPASAGLVVCTPAAATRAAT